MYRTGGIYRGCGYYHWGGFAQANTRLRYQDSRFHHLGESSAYMIPDIPLLAILPVNKLLTHETHDQQRIPQLLEHIRESGLLRNPPIVTPLRDRTGRFMILDGAHRVLALDELRLPHILAQVVEPDDPGLDLNPWNHVVWELDPNDFMEGFRNIVDLRIIRYSDQSSFDEPLNKQPLALIHLANHETYSAFPPTYDLETRLAFLHTIVDSYKNRANLDRTSLQNIDALSKIYPHLSGLVMLPRFRIEEILCIVGEGYLLPAGSTHFTISPRVLHVNYPIDELASDKSLEEKDNNLQKWLQERIAKKGVRHYAEATILFDE